MKANLKPTRLQVFSFVASMPVIAFVLNYILYDEAIFHNARIWLLSFPLLFLAGAVSWRTQITVHNWIQYRFPSLKETRTRVLLLAAFILPIMSCSITIVFYCYGRMGILDYRFQFTDLQYGLLVGFCVNLVFITLYELDYVVERLKESLQEKENLKQQALQHEFDVLKNQVNPHFLFNCFNTLSSLISEDKQRAETFLNELSKVYRYLLRNNEDGLSTVENEVRFIRSYYGLLQTRHGEALQMHIHIDAHCNPFLLPSLSLQLLVENVVKHNQLSKTRPLVITISTAAGNKLVVTNNLQRRAVKAPGNRIGLDNIRAKYELLHQYGFEVMEDEKNFTVMLPLIRNSAAEGKLTLLQEQKSF